MAQDFFYKTVSHEPSELSKKHWFYINQTGWYRCRSDYETFYKSYYDYQLQYILRGKGYIKWGQRIFPAGPGDLVLLDMNRSQFYYADKEEPWEFYWVHFGFEHFETYFQLLKAWEQPIFVSENRERAEYQFRELFDMFETHSPGAEPQGSLLMNQIVTDLMAAHIKRGAFADHSLLPNYPEPVRQAISFMEYRYPDTIKLEDISESVNLSAYHFSRLFRRATDCSVMDYLTVIRLNQAKNLLFHTNLTVGEIAEQVGFKDQGHFCRIFKKHERLTPRSYRNSKKQVDVS